MKKFLKYRLNFKSFIVAVLTMAGLFSFPITVFGDTMQYNYYLKGSVDANSFTLAASQNIDLTNINYLKINCTQLPNNQWTGFCPNDSGHTSHSMYVGITVNSYYIVRSNTGSIIARYDTVGENTIDVSGYTGLGTVEIYYKWNPKTCSTCGAHGNYDPNHFVELSSIQGYSTQPVISTHPGNVSVNEGTAAVFSCSASPVTSYQWYKNDAPVQGATGSTYSFVTTAADNNASIYCIAYNGSLSAVSNRATLSVNAYPKITRHPQGATVVYGGNVSLVCTASPVTSYQWYKNNVAIPGATSGTYSYKPSLSDDKAVFYCVAYNNGLTATSNTAMLRVNGNPVIQTQPINTVTLEDKQTLFSCLAASPLGVTYQWQKLMGGTWKNIPNENGTTLIITPKLSDNGSQYRCICTNSVGNTTSNTAKLTVGSASIVDITVQYPRKEIDYNQLLKASELFAVIKYNNGNAIVAQNLEGLKFDSVEISTEDGRSLAFNALDADQYIFSELGDYTFTTKYTATVTDPYTNAVSEKTFRPVFKIKCVDRQAPEFVFQELKWENGEPVESLTKEADKNVLLSVLASDNVTNDSDIEYEWFRRDGENKEEIVSFHNTNSILKVTSYMGNGIYIVRARDEAGNISKEHEIAVTVWDFEAPQFTYEIIPDGVWSNAKDINIYASDDVALAANAYYLTKQATGSGTDYSSGDWIPENAWISLNSFHVKENGVYSVYVRDQVGNVVTNTLTIDKIDAIVPVVELTAGKSKDLKSVEVKIKAFDDGGSGLYEENGTVCCFEADGQDIQITDMGGYVTGSFYVKKNDIYTVLTRDNAGNIAKTSITIDVRKILYGDDDELTLITNIKAENMDGSIYPAYTRGSIRLEAEIEDGMSLPSAAYSWDYEGAIEEKWDGTGTWTNNNSLLVTENGVYTAYLKDVDDNVYRRSIEITSIDKILPVFEVEQDGVNLKIHASDQESGVGTILIDGGSLDTIQEKKYINGFKEVNEDVVISKNGTYKIYVFDMAGNRSDDKTQVITSVPETDYYTAVFRNYDGAILKSQKVKAGEDAAPPNTVSREGYTFTGWDTPYVNITKDTQITAVFVPGEGQTFYTVEFLNYDDAVLKSQKVEKGGDATPPNVTREGYVCTGWSGSYANVQGDVTVKAIFDLAPVEPETEKTEQKDQQEEEDKKEEEKIYYTVTFQTYDGSVLKSQAVEKGKDADPPKDPKKEGYVFTGWSGPYANIQGDVTVKAMFDLAPEKEEPKENKNISGGNKGNRTEPADNEVQEEIEEVVYIRLSEFADEARPLGISQEDTLARQEQEKDQPAEKSYFPNDDVTEVQQTQDKVEEQNGMAPGMAAIIGVTLLGIGGTIVYFLNKKYFWFSLPF